MMQHTWTILKELGYEMEDPLEECKKGSKEISIRQGFYNHQTKTEIGLGYELDPGNIIMPDMDGYYYEVMIWN